MCGISGFTWEDRQLIQKCSNMISHRGPDQHGIFTDKYLSSNGIQPMLNEDNSICITYNGEVYNYKEIRAQLKHKHSFRSDTDTEVILHAYEEYGCECLKRFNGMFAIAIWDSNKKELFLARDRLGIKPLYYYFNNGKLMFASEIKAITANKEIKKELNIEALKQLMETGHTFDGHTLFKYIYELGPGHFLVFKKGNIDIRRYWDIDPKAETNTEQYYFSLLKEKLKQSIDSMMISDVPLGVSLSGGIDSSVIVALMSKMKKDPIKTFTIGFDNNDEEIRNAKIVAEHCSTAHNEVIATYKEITNCLKDTVWHMEVPYGRPAVIPTYLLNKNIKKHVTVSLVGEGSDEIFAGYNRYHPFARPNLAKVLSKPSFFLKTVYYRLLPKSAKAKYIASGYFNSRYNLLSRKFQYFIKPACKEELLNYVLAFEVKHSLPGIQLNRVDKASMASAVETRVPFLDHNVVEAAMKIPHNLKWNNFDKKHILQKIAREILPMEIANRKKLPFHIPLMDYFRTEFIHIAESTLEKTEPYFPETWTIIEKIKNEKFSNDNRLRQILFITTFRLWRDLFLKD
jgi:asparagine synthase (glutamine-hydrolysing)